MALQNRIMRFILKRKMIKAQHNGYTCGVYSIRFLLLLFWKGERYSIKYIMKNCGLSKKEGLSPDNVVLFLNNVNFYSHNFRRIAPKKRGKPYEVIFRKDSNIEELSINLPAMVNYLYDGEGHWSVIISKISDCFLIYNPWIGDLQMYSCDSFESVWRSKRYYVKSFISIKSL